MEDAEEQNHDAHFKKLAAEHVANTMRECLAAKQFIQVFPHFNKLSGLNPNQAMVYQTLLSIGRASEKSHKYRTVGEDGRLWVQIATPYLIDFMGWDRGKEKTLRRVLKEMETAGLIASRESGTYNRAKWFHLCGLWDNMS